MLAQHDNTCFISVVNVCLAVPCHAAPCCADPHLGNVNEGETKWAVHWDYSHLTFVQEAMSVTWSGVEIVKLVKSDGKHATSG